MTSRDIKFRCSSLGYLMSEGGQITEIQLNTIKELSEKPKRTEKQDIELARLIHKRDHPELSEGTKTHLVDTFVSAVYKRKEDASGKQIEKGNDREEDSISLLSRVSKIFYKKNDIRLSNEFIQGETDLFLGEKIQKAEETIDTKTSWSLHTFYRAKMKKLDPMWKWQGVGYMFLTGAKKHTVALCLVNGTEKAINDEKRKLSFSMGVIDPEANPEYIEKCKQIEINHIFDIKQFIAEYPHFDFANNIDEWCYDIPFEKRVHRFTFDRNEKEIEALQSRIIDGWDWMDKNLFNNQ